PNTMSLVSSKGRTALPGTWPTPDIPLGHAGDLRGHMLPRDRPTHCNVSRLLSCRTKASFLCNLVKMQVYFFIILFPLYFVPCPLNGSRHEQIPIRTR